MIYWINKNLKFIFFIFFTSFLPLVFHISILLYCKFAVTLDWTWKFYNFLERTAEKNWWALLEIIHLITAIITTFNQIRKWFKIFHFGRSFTEIIQENSYRALQLLHHFIFWMKQRRKIKIHNKPHSHVYFLKSEFLFQYTKLVKKFAYKINGKFVN